MAARNARAVLRGLLRQAGSAPAVFTGHSGAARSATARLGLRARFGSAPAPPPAENQIAELRREILEVRKEMLDGIHRVWVAYEGLLTVNHELLEKMCTMQSEASKNQTLSLENMIKTSYCILASGGAFMLAMFTVMSPLVKSAWQQEKSLWTRGSGWRRWTLSLRTDLQLLKSTRRRASRSRHLLQARLQQDLQSLKSTERRASRSRHLLPSRLQQDLQSLKSIRRRESRSCHLHPARLQQDLIPLERWRSQHLLLSSLEQDPSLRSEPREKLLMREEAVTEGRVLLD